MKGATYRRLGENEPVPAGWLPLGTPPFIQPILMLDEPGPLLIDADLRPPPGWKSCGQRPGVDPWLRYTQVIRRTRAAWAWRTLYTACRQGRLVLCVLARRLVLALAWALQVEPAKLLNHTARGAIIKLAELSRRKP